MGDYRRDQEYCCGNQGHKGGKNMMIERKSCKNCSHYGQIKKQFISDYGCKRGEFTEQCSFDHFFRINKLSRGIIEADLEYAIKSGVVEIIPDF